MNDELVRYSVTGAIAEITLDRAPVNAPEHAVDRCPAGLRWQRRGTTRP